MDIRDFSGLGRYFGMGPHGFADMAGQMTTSAFSGADLEPARRFGMVGAGISEASGLSQLQRGIGPPARSSGLSAARERSWVP